MTLFKIDDIIAALLLSLAMFRRLETISTSKQDNPHVPEAAFDAWKAMALSGYAFVAAVCGAKVFISVGWFVTFRDSPGVLQVGGFVIFMAWLVAIVVAWRRLTEANARRRELGIGRRPSK